MRIALVTGVSRGLGESVARYLLESNIHVIGVARNENEFLVRHAKKLNMTYQFIQADLSVHNEVVEMLSLLDKTLAQFDLTTLYVINNAGMLEPMDQGGQIDSHLLKKHFQLNTLTPMMITNYLLHQQNKKDYTLIIANISSGAATRPVYGWSAYSSSKAALNMYTKTIALEQNELKTDNKICGFSPGVMDTHMQEKIRSKDKSAFIEVENFKQYKANNLLKETDNVACVLVDILTDSVAIENGKIYHVTDYI